MKMPFALMILGVLFSLAGAVWQLKIERRERALQAHTVYSSHTDVSLVRDAAIELVPGPVPQMYLFSPEEDGRYKRLCVPEDVCLPIDTVAAFIRKEGTTR